jgi:flavin reductase (DIM6/NTAB) family NADH-FMN oxidoreductase RutF
VWCDDSEGDKGSTMVDERKSRVSASESEIPSDVFRRVMGRFASGVTVITARVDGEIRGMTASAFMSVSLDPPLCLISVGVRAQMHRHLGEAGAFGVSILGADQEPLALHFGGRPMEGVRVGFREFSGIPMLEEASAWLVADIVATHPCGDHTLFVGGIRGMGSDERSPLVYHAGAYGRLAPPSDQ